MASNGGCMQKGQRSLTPSTFSAAFLAQPVTTLATQQPMTPWEEHGQVEQPLAVSTLPAMGFNPVLVAQLTWHSCYLLVMVYPSFPPPMWAVQVLNNRIA